MEKYKISLTKESSSRAFYKTIVEAADKEQAIKKAVSEAKETGLFIPNEIWVHAEQLTTTQGSKQK